jgi:hypothetical protein
MAVQMNAAQRAHERAMKSTLTQLEKAEAAASPGGKVYAKEAKALIAKEIESAIGNGQLTVKTQVWFHLSKEVNAADYTELLKAMNEGLAIAKLSLAAEGYTGIELSLGGRNRDRDPGGYPLNISLSF